jgi:hypothetical protein
MIMKPVWLILVAIALASSQGFASAPKVGNDSVKIIDVKSAKIPGTDLTSYKVRVSYKLASAAHGKVSLGFELNEPKHFKMMSEAKVKKGTGEIEVAAGVKVPARKTLAIYVNLAEDPHPYRWIPLANDTRQVAVVK